MPCSRWLASPARMISMHRICARGPTRHPRQPATGPCSRAVTLLASHERPATDADAAARKAKPLSLLIPLNRRSCGTNFSCRLKKFPRPITPPPGAGAALMAKNTLTAADANLVGDAFERRLSVPSSEAAAFSNDDPSVPQTAEPQVIAKTESTDPAQAKGIDKSILTLAIPRRYRNREHVRYVAQQV